MMAALFSLPFGFSFVCLRIFVLLLGLIGVLVFYLFINRVTKNNVIAFVGALILMVNPLYCSLSFSFMTDVPFLVFALTAIFFFYKSLELQSRKLVIMGTVFAIIATLIRQFGIIIPIAYSAVFLIRKNPKWKEFAIQLIPVIIIAAALKFTLMWMEHIGSPLRPFEGQHVIDFLKKPDIIAYKTYDRIGDLLVQSGFFLLPIVIYKGINMGWFSSRGKRITTIIVLFIFIMPILHTWGRFPFGDYTNSGYIGPTNVKVSEGFQLYSFSNQLIYAIGILGIIGAVLLLLNLVNLFSSQKKENKHIFILFCILCYACLTFIDDAFFDRYFLLPVPLFYLLVAANEDAQKSTKRIQMAVACLFFFVLAGYSVAGTHDYMERNRSRWQALNYLTGELKTSPHKIDGGYEFNGWNIGRFFKHVEGRSWWYVDDDEYVVTYDTLKGYKVIKQFPYRNDMPYCEKKMNILHRE